MTFNVTRRADGALREKDIEAADRAACAVACRARGTMLTNVRIFAAVLFSLLIWSLCIPARGQHLTRGNMSYAKTSDKELEQFAAQFGRTTEQQKQYEADFELKSVFGFEFGSIGSNHTVKLERPFRYFTEVELSYTGFDHRLGRVCLMGKMPENATKTDWETEMQRVADVFKQKFGVRLLGRQFKNKNFLILINGDCDHSRVYLINRRIGAESEAARLAAEKAKPSLALPPDAGTDVLVANNRLFPVIRESRLEPLADVG